MGWYERFKDAMHAKPPPETPLPPGPSRVRDWWRSHVCPCPPLDYVRDAHEAGESFEEHVRGYWFGGAGLTPEDQAAMDGSFHAIMGTMVQVMTAAEEQGVEWPDAPVPSH